MKEWDYEKNGNLTPNVLFPASNKKVWWKCSKNHSWFASINNRTNLGNGCPYCTNHKVWKGFNDLQTLFGDIAQEWNYEKNGDITPSDVMAGSNTKFWWKCEQGHEWETTVNHRTLGNGCPICAGKKVLPGFNDLATLFPQLLCEWDYEKNKINPSMIMPGSNKRIWWKCERGHEWQTTLHNRTSLKRGCPKCAKELSTSFPEQALFYYINQVFSDALNGNKEVLKGYELDIYIPSKSVAIEYDGVAWHKDNKAVEREIHKNKICSENEITLIRIREDGLKEYSDCYCIMRNNNSSEEELEHIIQKILKILGIESINVNLDRDRSEIQNAYIHGARKTNFSRLFPELAKTWNYSKNGLLMPEMFSPHSNKRVWWVCEKGHEWCVAINNRVKTSYCPKCNGIRRRNTKRVVIPGYNDVRTVFSGLMIEWNYEKNVGILPEELIYTSTEKVWWVCEKGHEWYAKRY